MTLSGANTYTGPTSVNAGTLALNNTSGFVLGATAVTVGNGTSGNGTLLIDGSNTIGTGAGGSLAISGGTHTTGQGTLTFASSESSPSTLLVLNTNSGATVLTIGSAASPAILNFNLGSSGADRVDVLQKVAVGAGGAVVNVNVLTTANPGVYPLITDAVLSSGSYASLTLGTLSGNLGNNRFSLSQSGSGVNATAENLVVQAAVATPSAAYWGGSQSTAWNTLNNPNTTANTNWLTAATGGTDTNQIPGATTDVYETANGGTTAAQTLGQNFTINSLTFNSLNTSGTTISPDGLTLTIAAAAGAYPVGMGILVASGSGANTINAPLTLGGPQSWTNNSSNPLTIGGAVTNGGNLLTVAGSGHTTISGAINGGGGLTLSAPGGTLTLSSANTYGGVTTISAGTLQVSNTTGSGTGSGNVNVSSGGQLAGSGAIVLGSGNAVTVASNGTIVGGTLAAPLTISGGNGLTLAAGSFSSFAPTTASTVSPLLSVNSLFAPTGASTALVSITGSPGLGTYDLLGYGSAGTAFNSANFAFAATEPSNWSLKVQNSQLDLVVAAASLAGTTYTLSAAPAATIIHSTSNLGLGQSGSGLTQHAHNLHDHQHGRGRGQTIHSTIAA